jgi:prominin 1
MLLGSSRYRHLAVLFLSSVLLTLTPLSTAQAQDANILVCPRDGAVVLNADGDLEYGALPPNMPPDREQYSPQGLAGWYDLARGFVNTVQPENLPYDVIEATIEDNNLACSVRGEENCNAEEFDVGTTLRDFTEWWAPLVAVTVIGGVMAILFAIVGSIFCCCRCCGHCGGGRSKKDPQDLYMFITTVLLLLFALLCLVGVVLSFYSNEQSYDTIESFQQSVNSIVGTAVDYMNSFIDDGDTIFCQYIQVTDIALDETDRINNSLNELIDDARVDVDSVLVRLNGLSLDINVTSDILTNVSNTTQALQAQSVTLNMTLNNISASIDALRVSCEANPLVPPGGCDNIPASNIFETNADFNDLPNVTQELNEVQESLDGIDISSSIQQGRDEFDRITGDIQSEVNIHLGGLDESSDSSGVLGALTDANDTLFDTRNRVVGDIREVIMNNQTLEDCPDIFGGGFGSDIEVNVGFIRQCYFNQIFDRVQEYDVYRYALGIIICCMALLSVVLTLVGIALGVVGWRKDRSPDSRTRVSHCGGIVLLVNIGLMFLFGFVLLILSCLAFFFGANMQKICQAIEPSEYELFDRIVDNQEVWEGSLLGETVLGSGEILSLSDALRSCENNEALYTAFNLSSLFDVRMEVLNTTETFSELEQQLNDTIDSFDYTSDSFLDNSTRSALNDFTAASVESINITAFTDTLANDVLSFNLTVIIDTLRNLNNTFTSASQPGLASATDNIVVQLEDIEGNQLPAIEMNVDLLERQVAQLSTHINGVVSDTNAVVDDIDGLVMNLTGAEFRERIRSIATTTLNNLEGYINSFLNHTATLIETDVGQCRPLTTIYLNAYDVVCNEAVDGLNGYWWSLGFCALCFIPLIILAAIASTHYLKQNRGIDDDAYPEYPMKSY